MGAPIPAVCLNPSCRTVFLSGGVSVIGSVTFLGNALSCPKCGQLARVPDGRYTAVPSGTLYTPHSDADRRFLESALAAARQALDSAGSPEEAIRKAKEAAPELSSIWDRAPLTHEAFAAYLSIVLTALTLLLTAYSTLREQQPAEIQVPKEVIDAIESLRPSTQNDSRGDTHKEPRKRREY
jgi:hypothetical protein